MLKKQKEKFVEIVFLLMACISIASVSLICLFLFINGLPAIKEIGFVKFFFGTEWKPSSNVYGILPMIIGSILVTLGATIIGGVIGVLTATYMAMFASKKTRKIMEPLIHLMAGIPSVVYGFFGLMVIVPFIRDNLGGRGMSLITAAILLGVMILPTIINISLSSIEQVPDYYYQGSLALGATHEISVFKVVLPAAKNGIVASIVLGIGRALGETMAVMMVVGNQAIIPSDITDGVRTLTTNIVLEMGYATDLHRQALIATAVVLFAFILIINFLFSFIKRRNTVG